MSHKTSILLDGKNISGTLDHFCDKFDHLPNEVKTTFLSAILSKKEVKRDQVVIHVMNLGLRIVGDFGCYPGESDLVDPKGWLPKPESVLTTGPLILYQRNQDLSFYKWFADEEFLRRECSELGKSIKQIARDLNCSASTIAKYLLEVGIEPRAERLPRQRRG